jgi:hypothetical protein
LVLSEFPVTGRVDFVESEHLEPRDRDVSELRGDLRDLRGEFNDFRGEMRDFRKATTASFNALRADFVDLRQDFAHLRNHVDHGFIEMRGKLDAAAAGQQQIVNLLETIITDRNS